MRAATLRGLHQTSLYMRLIRLTKEKGARIAETGQELHRRLAQNPVDGTNLLKFAYGQLYNDNLTIRYGHAPTDASPLCYLHDSCTHIYSG